MFLRNTFANYDGTEDTRRRASRAELLTVHADTDLVDEIIDIYAGYRLLKFDNDSETRMPMVEVAHEALLLPACFIPMRIRIN